MPREIVNGAIGGGSSRVTPIEERSKWPFIFLCLFTMAIYARPEDLFPLVAPLHLTLLSVAAAGLAFVASLLKGNVRLRWPLELRISLLLTTVYVAGLPFAYWRGGSFHVLTALWLKTLFAFFLLTQLVTSLDRVRKVIWAIVVSELLVCTFSIAQSSTAIWVGDRLLGLNLGILGWNYLGIALAFTIPYIAAFYVLHRSLWKTALLMAAGIAMSWMLVMTASRSGFLCVVFSIGLTSLFVLPGSARGRTAIVGLAVMMLLAAGVAPQVFWQRVETIWQDSDAPTTEAAASAAESGEDRMAVLNRSIDYTLENPVFGLGLGNFGVASGTLLGQPSAWMGTHNAFTQVSSEAGIPALLLFLSLFIVALSRMWRAGRMMPQDERRRELRLMARATLVSVLAFAFGGFFAHLAYDYYLFYLVAFACGIHHVATQAEQSAAVREFAPLPGAAASAQIA